MRSIKIFVCLSALFICTQSYSQYYYYNDKYFDRDWIFELGAGLGGMNSITDIGGSKGKGGLYINDMNLKYTQLSGTVYFGALYRDLAGVRLEATIGSVRGADDVLKGTSDENGLLRYNRNLNFFSTINEVAILGEFYPVALFAKEPPVLSPYVMAGLGWFKFNPQVNINGRYVDLKPLRTEGQGFPEYKGRDPYHLTQANVPFGIGVKYELSSLFTIRLEALHRFLFTDYIDDVSTSYIDRDLFAKYLSPVQAAQANAVYDLKKETEPIEGGGRGNPDSKDSYMTLTLKVGVTLGRERRR